MMGFVRGPLSVRWIPSTQLSFYQGAECIFINNCFTNTLLLHICHARVANNLVTIIHTAGWGLCFRDPDNPAVLSIFQPALWCPEAPENWSKYTTYFGDNFGSLLYIHFIDLWIISIKPLIDSIFHVVPYREHPL